MFGLGLGGDVDYGGGRAHHHVRAAGAQEWEQAFKLESLSQEVASLAQERRAMRDQLAGAVEGVAALAGAVDLLARDVQQLHQLQHLQPMEVLGQRPPGRRTARQSGSGRADQGGASMFSGLGSLFDPVASAGLAAFGGSDAASRGHGNYAARVQAEVERARKALGGSGLHNELQHNDVHQVRFSNKESNEREEEKMLHAFFDSEEELSLEELTARASIPETHELEHSIWDACIFLGLNLLGRFDTWVLMASWFVNVTVQFLFTVVIWTRFHESPYNPELVHGLRRWRAVFGHEADLMNPATQESLVSSVCAGSDIVTNSQNQVKLYKTMREFLPGFVPDPLTGWIQQGMELPEYTDKGMVRDGGVPIGGYFFDGAMLCTMLMLLWTLMICRELRSTYETHSAVWAKASQNPRDTVIVKIPATGHLVLRSVTVRRAAIVTACVTLPRFVIACFLLVGGSYFIVAAENMEDLILNALSLEFIIHTDELLYSVIAPKSIRMVVEEVEPMSVGVFMNRFRRAFKITTIFVIIGYVCAVNFLVLGPVIASMKDAMNTMCGGDIDFVSQRYTDGITRVVDPTPLQTERMQYTYAYCAVLQRTGLAGATRQTWLGSTEPLIQESENFKCAGITKPKLVKEAFGTGELKRKGRLSLKSLPRYKSGGCADANVSGDSEVRLMLQEATGNHFLTKCSDAWILCGQPPQTGFASTLVRLYCPRTCGCAGPGQYFTGSGEGCPRSCGLEFQRGLYSVTARCKDLPPEELSDNKEWIAYVNSAVTYLMQLGTTWPMQLAQQLNRTAFANGCNTMTQKFVDPETRDLSKAWDFCDPIKMQGGFSGAEHRTVRFFCPAACKCAEACAKDSSCRDCPRGCAVVPTSAFA